MLGYNIAMANSEKRDRISRIEALQELWQHSRRVGKLAVADHYDALASDRCYRKRFKLSKVIQMLEDEAALGILNPGVVEKAVKLWGNGVR